MGGGLGELEGGEVEQGNREGIRGMVKEVKKG